MRVRKEEKTFINGFKAKVYKPCSKTDNLKLLWLDLGSGSHLCIEKDDNEKSTKITQYGQDDTTLVKVKKEGNETVTLYEKVPTIVEFTEEDTKEEIIISSGPDAEMIIDFINCEEV